MVSREGEPSSSPLERAAEVALGHERLVQLAPVLARVEEAKEPLDHVAGGGRVLPLDAIALEDAPMRRESGA